MTQLFIFGLASQLGQIRVDYFLPTIRHRSECSVQP